MAPEQRRVIAARPRDRGALRWKDGQRTQAKSRLLLRSGRREKTMQVKRILGLLLAAAMLLGLSFTAYAAEDIRAAMERIASETGQDRIDLLGWSWGAVTTRM